MNNTESLRKNCLNKLINYGTDKYSYKYLEIAVNDTFSKGHLAPGLFPVFINEAINKNAQLAEELSVICTLFYTAADLVDDIEDHDLNNQVIKLFGKSQAINIVNNLIFITYQLIGDLFIDSDKKLLLYRSFSKQGNIMCSGQFNDLKMTNRIYESQSYFQDIITVNEEKGGAEFALFLSALPQALGMDATPFFNIGYYAGSLTQLLSDYLDIWAKSVLKKSYTDIFS